MNRIQMFLFLNSFAFVNMTHVCNSGHESITKGFLVPFKSDKYTRCDADDINENFFVARKGHTIMVKQIIQPLIRRVGTQTNVAQDLLLPSKHFAFYANFSVRP